MNKQLIIIRDALEKADITYWLAMGSFLQLYRDDSLKENDDLDFGIPSKDVKKMLNIRHPKFEVVPKYITIAGEKFLRCLKLENTPQNWVQTDFGVYMRKGEFLFRPPICKRRKYKRDKISDRVKNFLFRFQKKYFPFFNLRRDFFLWEELFSFYYTKEPVSYIAPRKEYIFDGVRIIGPSKPEKYLKYHYGKWKIPVKDWNYCRDDKSVREVSNVTELLRKSSRL